MEKKKVQIPKFKTVKDGFEEKEVFVSEDGKEFSSASQCKEHEAEVARKKIYANIRKIHDGDLVNLGCITWFFCTTKEEVDLVYETNNTYVYFHEREIMQPNRWFGIYYEDGGDHRGDVYVYDLETVRKETEEFFKKFEEN